MHEFDQIMFKCFQSRIAEDMDNFVLENYICFPKNNQNNESIELYIYRVSSYFSAEFHAIGDKYNYDHKMIDKVIEEMTNQLILKYINVFKC